LLLSSQKKTKPKTRRHESNSVPQVQGQAETKLGLHQLQQVTTENAAKGHNHTHTAHVNMASLEHNDRYEAGYRIRKEVM
jgi:hypothetical protein